MTQEISHDMPSAPTLAKRLRLARDRSRLSQEAAAKYFDTSRAAVSQWETGETSPEIKRLQKIAETYKVTIDWLVIDGGDTGAGPKPANARPAGVPNRIREVRKAKAMTLEALADLVGTDKSQIRRLESGERRLTLEWMVRIAVALGVETKDLLPETINDRARER